MARDNIFWTLVLLCSCFTLQISAEHCKMSSGETSEDSGSCQAPPGDPEPLYLTPMIKSGKIMEAQDAALVTDEIFAPVKSYSGFITVNEEYKSNLFFWFFPAEGSSSDFNNKDIPVILWSDGGPGMSTMYTVFSDNGPFKGIKDDPELKTATFNGVKIIYGKKFKLNPLSWHKKYHMIYLDNPVGTGFSHTGSEEGHVRTAQEAAKDIYSFLTQFFELFPTLKRNPFYNAGCSYGGTYAAEIAYKIHQENEATEKDKINLTGVIMDSPWIDGTSQALYGEVLFNAGLISLKDKNDYLQREEKIRNLVENGGYSEAFKIWWDLARGSTPKLTGYQALYNTFDDVSRSVLLDMSELVTEDRIRRALHAGNGPFHFLTFEVITEMGDAFMKSETASALDTVLKNDYKFLMYVGNMDVITALPGIRKLFEEKITWDGAEEYLNGEREIMEVDGRVAGYVTKAGKAKLIVMRNAGHSCNADQPQWVWKAVTEFIGY